MSTELYNEGRVVGYSAYEIYIKQLLSENPTAVPATEKEWLASSVANGSSMLLYVDTDEILGSHSREIFLPNLTHLCAANTIMGNFFDGSGHLPAESVWADRVVDYGDLISNTASSSPNGVNISNIPTKTIANWSDIKKNQIKNYIKIVDGVILQPGTWAAGNKPPEKDLTPNLSKIPAIRLLLKDKIDTAFWLLLTGFTIKSVIQGTSGLDGSTNTQSPKDGDFLGPAVYPWANKIIFSVPNSYFRYFSFMSDPDTDGIALQEEEGGIRIINTAPDASYVTYMVLTKDVDYRIIPYNNMRSGGFAEDGSTVEILPLAEFDRKIEVAVHGDNKTYTVKISGTANHRDVFDLHGQTQLYLDRTPVATNRWQNFKFRHSYHKSHEIGVRSWLFAIKFLGEYAHLNSANLRDTGGSSTGIWNLTNSNNTAFGGSWSAVCNVVSYPTWTYERSRNLPGDTVQELWKGDNITYTTGENNEIVVLGYHYFTTVYNPNYHTNPATDPAVKECYVLSEGLWTTAYISTNPGYVPSYQGGYLISAGSYSDGWNTQIKDAWPQAVSSSNLNVTNTFVITTKKVTNITLIQQPEDVSYSNGQTLNTLGLTIKANYIDGTTSDNITSGFECYPMILNTNGTIPIAIKYRDAQLSNAFTVIVS